MRGNRVYALSYGSICLDDARLPFLEVASLIVSSLVEFLSAQGVFVILQEHRYEDSSSTSFRIELYYELESGEDGRVLAVGTVD